MRPCIDNQHASYSIHTCIYIYIYSRYYSFSKTLFCRLFSGRKKVTLSKTFPSCSSAGNDNINQSAYPLSQQSCLYNLSEVWINFLSKSQWGISQDIGRDFKHQAEKKTLRFRNIATPPPPKKWICVHNSPSVSAHSQQRPPSPI